MPLELDDKLAEYLKEQNLLDHYNEITADGTLTLQYEQNGDTINISTDNPQDIVDIVKAEGFAAMLRGGEDAAPYFEKYTAEISTASQVKNSPQAPAVATTPAPEVETVAKTKPKIDQAYHNALDNKYANLNNEGPVTFTKSDGTSYQLNGSEALDAMHLLGERGYQEALKGNDKYISQLEKYSQLGADVGGTGYGVTSFTVAEKAVAVEQTQSVSERTPIATYTMKPILPIGALSASTLLDIDAVSASFNKVIEEAKGVDLGEKSKNTKLDRETQEPSVIGNIVEEYNNKAAAEYVKPVENGVALGEKSPNTKLARETQEPSVIRDIIEEYNTETPTENAKTEPTSTLDKMAEEYGTQAPAASSAPAPKEASSYEDILNEYGSETPEAKAETTQPETSSYSDLSEKYSEAPAANKDETPATTPAAPAAQAVPEASAEAKASFMDKVVAFEAPEAQGKFKEALEVMSADKDFKKRDFKRAAETAREMGAENFLNTVKTVDAKDINWQDKATYSAQEKEASKNQDKLINKVQDAAKNEVDKTKAKHENSTKEQIKQKAGDWIKDQLGGALGGLSSVERSHLENGMQDVSLDNSAPTMNQAGRSEGRAV